MSNATRFDLTRPEIRDRYHQRIEQGDRTKLTREEREILTLILLDRLVQMNHQGTDTEAAIEQLCTAEIKLLEEGYPRKSIANQYLPDYTKLIKEAIDNDKIKLTDQNSFIKYWRKRNAPEVSGMTRTHYALEYLKYEPEQYASDRNETNEHNNDRQDNPGDVELDPYLEKIEELVYADEPELAAIAIAAITGRRHIEVVAQGSFSQTHHPYLIRFEGQAKKRDDQDNGPFEILTLIPAEQTLKLIDRFRTHPDVQPLLGLDDEHPDVQKFHARVNRRVEKIFGQSGLVPLLPGFKSVSIHRLRALWGAISFHFFAPGQKNPQRFLQHYLGHVSNEMRSSPNAPVTGHYFHYRLWRNGKELLAKGVKLAANGALPDSMLSNSEEKRLEHGEPVVLNTTHVDPPGLETAAMTTPSVSQAASASQFPKWVIDEAAFELEALPSRLPIYPDQYDQAVALLNEMFPHQAQIEQTAALFDWVKSHNSAHQNSSEPLDAEATATTPDDSMQNDEWRTMTQALIDQSASLRWHIQEIERLRQQLATAEAERDQLRATQQQSQPDPEVKQLRTRSAALASQNEQLTGELSRLQTEHDRVLHLLEPFKQILQLEAQPTSSAAGQQSPESKAVKPSETDQPALVTPAKPESTKRTRERVSEAPQTAVAHPRAGSTQQTDIAVATISVEDLKQLIVTPSEDDPNRRAKTRAAALLGAIFDWAAIHPQETVAVGGTFLEKAFGINREAANEFATENAHTIQQYYQRFGIIKPRTQNRGRDLGAFKEFVVQHANQQLPDKLKLGDTD